MGLEGLDFFCLAMVDDDDVSCVKALQHEMSSIHEGGTILFILIYL